MGTRVLLTGGLGFIGSHTVEHWLRNTDWEIVVMDALRCLLYTSDAADE